LRRGIREDDVIAMGSRVGPYEVTCSLGAGGMGEVFRARDAKLRRDVAIKVLPEGLASDPERRARFEREAHVLASLNHPNIAAILGFEEGPADSGAPAPALILELVDGPTLADRIVQRPIPWTRPCPWRSRSPRRSRPRTNWGSSIVI
jgi:serine/threonine-protein kinase